MGLPEFLHLIDEAGDDGGDAVPYSTLAELSGLGHTEAQELSEYLSYWSTERVRDLFARLTALVETDVQMEFESVFFGGLDSSDPTIRALSITGLGESDDPSLLRRLTRLMLNDESDEVRVSAAIGMSRIATLAHEDKLAARQAVDLQSALTDCFNDELEEVSVRRRALEALGVFQGEAIEAFIEIAYEDGDPELRRSAVHAMGRNCNTRWVEIVLAELDSDDPSCRYEAALALGQIGSEEHLPELTRLLDDQDLDVQVAAVRGLGGIGGGRAHNLLQGLLSSAEPLVAQAAAEAIQYLELEDLTMMDYEGQTEDQVRETGIEIVPGQEDEELYIDDIDLEENGFVSPGERDTTLDWVSDEEEWVDPMILTDEDLGQIPPGDIDPFDR